MKVLFICNQGIQRSPTAAELWKEMNNDETDYAGIYREDMDTEKKIEWADLIVVMEDHQRKFIADHYPKLYIQKKILCLDIPDIYFYMDRKLVAILKKKLVKFNV